MTKQGGTMPDRARRVGAARGSSTRGQTMAEYSVVLAVICLATLAAFGYFFDSVLQGTINHINTILTGV
jgi:Flp pilus assembly pilin Flp